MLMRLRIEQETVLDKFFHGIGSQLIRPVLGTAGADWPIPLTSACLVCVTGVLRGYPV